MIEDAVPDATLVEHTLKESGFSFAFQRVDTEDAFLKELERFQPSLILSDHGLPTFDGFAALTIAQDKAPDVPFIFVTGSLGEEMTIKALKSGATDFVLKHHLNTLPPAVHRAMRQAEFRLQRKHAEEALQSSEERYRRLVELSPLTIAVHRAGELLYINDAGARIFGLDPKALVGARVFEMLHPDDRAAVAAAANTIDSIEGARFVEHTPVSGSASCTSSVASRKSQARASSSPTPKT